MNSMVTESISLQFQQIQFERIDLNPTDPKKENTQENFLPQLLRKITRHAKTTQKKGMGSKKNAQRCSDTCLALLETCDHNVRPWDHSDH